MCQPMPLPKEQTAVAPDLKQKQEAALVLRKFRQIFNAVKTHFQQVEKAAGIGGAQLWALSVIHERADISVTELAQSMDIHQTTASNLVKALQNAGLVCRTRSPQDKRMVQLRCTTAATAVLQNAPAPFSGVLPAALAKMSPEVLQRLDTDLCVLLDLLNTDKNSAHEPLAGV